MRPYLAIIRDSFREALASRVLWLLFVLITLLLLLLAPFGYRQTVTRGLRGGAVLDWPHLLVQIRDDAKKPDKNPSQRLVELFDDAEKKKLTEFALPKTDKVDAEKDREFAKLLRDLRHAVNRQLDKRDFYDEAYWRKTSLISNDARKYAKTGTKNLTDDEAAHFNRLLMESSYPEFVSPGPPTSIRFRYLWFDLFEPLPISKKEIAKGIDSWLPFLMNYLVGGIGVVIAIGVTSSFIPQTFDPGVLSLLLSKPIHRWLIFLAKVLGGCVFITLNISYLIFGLYLILGCELGIWEQKLFLFIPIYVFVFAIYYSVSSVAGLIWRNPIVSMVVSLLFWGCCFGVGFMKWGYDEWISANAQTFCIVPAGDDLMIMNEAGKTFLWDKTKYEWREIFVPSADAEMQRRFAIALVPSMRNEWRPIGPLYDTKNQCLISTYRAMPYGQMNLNIGKRDEDWKNEAGASASLGTLAMLHEADGNILIVSNLGLFRLAGDPLAKPEPTKVFGITVPLPTSGPYESVGPESNFVLTRPVDVKSNPSNGMLATISRGTISLLEKQPSGRYAVARSRDLKLEAKQGTVLSYSGETVLVGLDDGRILLLDTATLEEVNSFSPEGNTPPRFIAASPSGRYFAIVFQNDELWIYDAQEKVMNKANVIDQGDVACVAFRGSDHLLVAHHTTRVSEYDIASGQRIATFAPPMSFLETVYRYVVWPLYYVFPKPGELDRTVKYLLTGKETAETGTDRRDMVSAQQQLHPWRPVVSSFVFTLVVLGLGCVYIERQEF